MNRICLIVILIPSMILANHVYDVAVVAHLQFHIGIGRNAIGVLDHYQNDLEMCLLETYPDHISHNDIPANISRIPYFTKKDFSKVSIYFDILDNANSRNYPKMPSSHIKLAYTMMETTLIPLSWVSILNNHFDAAVVPDKNLVSVYKNSGVTIPVFVVPHGVYIEEFLKMPPKQTPQNPFVFGVVCNFWEHKNCIMLLDAFAKEFGNDPKVTLKIHSSSDKNEENIRHKITQLQLQNVELSVKSLDWSHYITHMESHDCYILISKGEGFSVTPREALAATIPTIITNNSAHKTICESGFVYAIASDIEEKQSINPLFRGNTFNCRLSDVCKAMRDVYLNYDRYLEKAKYGREWVKKYQWKNLNSLWLNLLKPKKVLLGNADVITEEYLMTTSQELYDKYNDISIPKKLSKKRLLAQKIIKAHSQKKMHDKKHKRIL